VASGEYPSGVHLSARTVAWLAVEIIELVERKEKEARESMIKSASTELKKISQ